MEIEWLNTILTAVTMFFAAIVHGISGFGFAQVSMGILPLFRSAASAAAIFSVVAVVSNFRVWWSVRKDFDWKHWLKLVIGLAAGMPLGIYVFNQLDENQVRLAIGIVLLAAVFFIIVDKQTSVMKNWFKNKEYQDGYLLPIIVGFLAGILGGAVAIPGPPMIVYGTFMVATGVWTGEKMKAIFTAFFGTLMLYRVLAITVQGDITGGWLLEALIAIPAMLVGAWIGIYIFEKIPKKIFSWVVLALLTVNAFILLFT